MFGVKMPFIGGFVFWYVFHDKDYEYHDCIDEYHDSFCCILSLRQKVVTRSARYVRETSPHAGCAPLRALASGYDCFALRAMSLRDIGVKTSFIGGFVFIHIFMNKNYEYHVLTMIIM